MEYGVDGAYSQSFLRVGSGNVGTEISVTGISELIYYRIFYFRTKVQEIRVRNSQLSRSSTVVIRLRNRPT